MPACGSQIVLCDVPVRFDTYKGCSHACKYCFVQRKADITEIYKNETVKALKNFIKGERTNQTNWCDWNIPLHWGGMSDPFQPIEKVHRLSYECLKLFAETQYPFIVSTKGKLIVEPEYIELLSKCNCVVQISMVCSQYDVMEKGCPTYEERLEMVRKLSPAVKRVNVRIQPYMTQVYKDVKNNMKRVAEAGAHGVILEGMKFASKKKGLVKVGGDYCYPKDVLESHFISLKKEAHKYGLKFYCGENRLRTLGDAMCCCGIEDMEGFKGNTYNLCHILNGKEYEVTEAMKKNGSATVFRNLLQDSVKSRNLGVSEIPLEQYMLKEYERSKDSYNAMFGLKGK